MVIKATLCYIVQNGRILLIRKKRGFGAGKMNAPGGKIEDGESPAAAAARELEEEIGIRPQQLQLLAEIDFHNDGVHEMHVYVFRSRAFEGTLRETEEADPKWFPVSDIPYDEMWPDDRIWLPLFLQGRKIKGTFHFRNGWKEMTEHEIEELG